jgi:MFS transporter, ACS family, hexuronate transporter
MWRPHKLIILTLVIFAGVLNYADRQIIAVLKPLMQQALHWSDADYGRLGAAFQFAAAVAFLAAGPLVDRLGWRRANPLAVGAWSLAAMTHVAARTTAQFTLARLSLGATEALGTPTAIKTLSAVFKAEERPLAIGVMNASTGLGAILTPLIAPALALAVGWTGAFLIAGGLGLVWVAAWLLVTPRIGVVEAEPPGASTPAKARLSTVLRDRRTWAVAGAKALSDQVWWLFLFWTPDLLHRVFHLEVKDFGAPLAAIYACASAGSLLAGALARRLSLAKVDLNIARKGSLLVAAALVTPVWFAASAPGLWWAIAILGLALAAHQTYSLNIFALITEMSPKAQVATVTSIGAFCGNLAGMAIVQAAGWVLEAKLGYGPLLAWASMSYLLGVAWIQLLVPKIKLANQDETND